jgi:putative membrane protein
MKQIFRRLLMISGVALMSGTLALAQQQPMGSAPGAAPENPAATNPEMNSTQQMQQTQNSAEGNMMDKAFVQKALQGGMAEVELGKLAEQKGASADVRQFGQKMVEDHTRLGSQMKQVAQNIGVRDPHGLSKKDQKLVAKLESLSGAQFDDAYIQVMVKDHKKDLSDFRQEVGNTQNNSLRQVAEQGAKVIDGHLQLIDQIAKTHDIKS